MIPVFLVFLREVLEITLILGVVAAATPHVAGRNRYLVGGVGLGVLVSIVLASLTSRPAAMADGMGQELFQAGLLSVAVVTLGWTVVWMRRHGVVLAQRFRTLGQAVAAQEAPLTAMLLLVALAVVREGVEIILILYGALAGTPLAWGAFATGALLGTLAGAAAGYALYTGCQCVLRAHMFRSLNTLLTLLASGLAAQAAGLLVAADTLPVWHEVVWDSSAWLPQGSVLGTLLHVLVGYTDRPSAMQLVWFLATYALITLASRHVVRRALVRKARARNATWTPAASHVAL